MKNTQGQARSGSRRGGAHSVHETRLCDVGLLTYDFSIVLVTDSFTY